LRTTLATGEVRVDLVLHAQPVRGDLLGNAPGLVEIRKPGLQLDVAYA